MTPQEAYELLNTTPFTIHTDGEVDKIAEAYLIAIDTLKKEKAMKPNPHSELCPACDKYGIHESDGWGNLPRCCECGQLIDWESDNMPEITKNTFGENLKVLIWKAGMTHTEFANASNITEIRLVRYLEDKKEPEMTDLKNMAKVLGLSVDELIGVANNE